MDPQVLAAIITALTVIFGWFAIFLLKSWADLANKKREIRIDYLLKAYRCISSSAVRKTTPEQQYLLESAIEDVQLLGNKGSIEVISRLEKADFRQLLELIRTDLRKELNLRKVVIPIRHFRHE